MTCIVIFPPSEKVDSSEFEPGFFGISVTQTEISWTDLADLFHPENMLLITSALISESINAIE